MTRRDTQLSSHDIDLGDWLAPFAPAERERVDAWVEQEQAIVFRPDTRLERFRLDPATALGIIQDGLATLDASRAIAWLLENHDNQGLDAFEAEAVFGTWLAVEILEQADPGEPLSRLVVCGRHRERLLGLAARIDPYRLIESTFALARIAHQQTPPVALLFLDRPAAEALLTRLQTPARMLLRHALRRMRAKLGLFVPSERTDHAIADMREETAPLRELSNGYAGVCAVRFDDAGCAGRSGRLAQAMASAGIRFDCSLVPAVPAPGATEIDGAFPRHGAYAFASFDLRVAAQLWSDDAPLELVRWPSPSLGGTSLAELPGRLLEVRLSRLAALLDFKRMERYFQDLESDPALGCRYHEYRVYNWPRPEGRIATCLIDLGLVQDAAATLRGVDGERIRLSSQHRTRLAAADDFVSAACAEAHYRASTSSRELLQTQVDDHEYLAQTACDTTLRADLANFVAWLPSNLALVLELGSGHGQLARTLVRRASGYVCIDLSHAMLEAASSSEIEGVLADAHELPFADRSFDTIIANNSLEHLYDPVRALSEARRVLRPGGALFALIPLDALNPEHEIRTHLWKADVPGITAAFQSAGLQVQSCEVIDINALGVTGSFPTCYALVSKVHAIKN